MERIALHYPCMPSGIIIKTLEYIQRIGLFEHHEQKYLFFKSHKNSELSFIYVRENAWHNLHLDKALSTNEKHKLLQIIKRIVYQKERKHTSLYQIIVNNINHFIQSSVRTGTMFYYKRGDLTIRTNLTTQ